MVLHSFPFFSFPRCTFALHLIRLNSQLWQISFFSSSPHPFFLSFYFFWRAQSNNFFLLLCCCFTCFFITRIFLFRFLSDTAASTFSATSASAAPTFTHTTSSLLLLSSLLRALMFCRASRSALHLQTPNSQAQQHTPLSIGGLSLRETRLSPVHTHTSTRALI